MRTIRLAVLGLGVAACHQAPVASASLEPASRAEWNGTLAQASQEVAAGRYGVADRVLTDYATRNPASADAAEALYWRALYKLDPANQNASPREAASMLDGYLAGAAAQHRVEATTLRRLVSSMEGRSAAMSAAMANAPKGDPAADKSKDDEIQRLNAELAKANAELERIKKRLAQPKP